MPRPYISRHWRLDSYEGLVQAEGGRVLGYEDYLFCNLDRHHALELIQTLAVQLQNDEYEQVEIRFRGKLELDGEVQHDEERA